MNKRVRLTCVVCSTELEVEYEFLFTFRELPDKGPINSTEVENMYFQVPWTWRTLFRASEYIPIASFCIWQGIRPLTAIDGSYPSLTKRTSRWKICTTTDRSLWSRA